VTVAPVERRPVPIEIQAVGHVEPVSSVSIRSQVDGEILRVEFGEGQEVGKGQVLFEIDPRPYRAELAQARANLARNRAQAVNAAAQARRYSDLVKKDYVTREQYDQIRAEASASQASVQADEAAVRNARLKLENATLTAPIAGRTGSLLVHAGNLVRAGDPQPLVVINQIRPVHVSFALPEQSLQEVRQRMAGGPLKVTSTLSSSSDQVRVGTLTFIDNAVDPATGSILAKATFPNEDGALWPGVYTRVVVTLGVQPDAVVVPSQAVQSGQQGSFVYIVKPDQTVAPVAVVVDRTYGGDAVLARGPDPGQAVVTDGQLRLSPGAKVAVRREASAPS
jgi:multidrug efflux system membrane fusion protein